MPYMVTSDRDKSLPNIRRWQIDNATPLEVWDVVIEERTLWSWQKEECFPEVLSLALGQLVNGTAIGSEGRVIQNIPISYDRLYITGGGSQSEGLKRQFPQVCFGSSPIFGACEAALGHWNKAVAIDVGQTQIKIAYEDERISIPRDLKRLPVQGPSDYSCLLNFIIRSLPELNPQHVVLALPCSIGLDLELGDSSYSSMGNNPRLLKDVSQAYPRSTWHIINDAELATLCATEVGKQRTLVLTLGFGVGACIVDSRG